MKTMPSYQFTEKHPPLLQNLGFGGITKIKEAKGPESHYEMIFSIQVPLENGTPFFPYQIPGILTKQKVWVRLAPPVRLSGTEIVSVTETLSQSYEELKSLRALVSTNVSASYGPVSAEISAEIESTRTQTSSWSKERSHTKTVEREGHHMYADWILIDRITIDYDLSQFEVHDGFMKRAMEENRRQARKAVSKYDYYETFLSKYEDDLPDDRVMLANMFSPFAEMQERVLVKN